MKNYQDFCNDMTTKLFDIIDRNNSILKWKQGWQVAGSIALPFSRSGRYHGGNLFSLLCAQLDQGYNQNKWITFNQVREAGGSVLKGAKSQEVYFWSMRKIKEESNGETIEKTIPIFKTYRVFNIEQTSLSPEVLGSFNLLEIDAILSKHKVALSTFGNQPRYQPADDVIVMPKKECFNSEQSYLVTLLHELVHATGHASRLDRQSMLDYATSKGRAEEELTAEIVAVFLAAHFRIDGDLYNHASYVDHWKTILSPKEIMRAVNNASKAFEYLIAD